MWWEGGKKEKKRKKGSFLILATYVQYVRVGTPVRGSDLRPARFNMHAYGAYYCTALNKKDLENVLYEFKIIKKYCVVA